MSKLKTGILLAGVALVAGPSAFAGTCAPSGPLHGDYGVSLQGQRVNGPPYASVGLLSIEKSSFSLRLTVSDGGVVTQRSIDGTLAVEDCGVTFTGQGPNSGFMLKGQIAKHGKEIFLTEIQQGQPVVASGTMRPVGVRRCREKTLNGRYTYISQGHERSPSGGLPWVPIGKIGHGNFNGKGCLTYEESIKQGPDLSKAAGALAYKVMENCTVELIDAGKTVFFGVLTDSGNQMAYLQVTDSAVRSGDFQWSGRAEAARSCP